MDTKTTLLSTLPILIILASLGGAIVLFPQNNQDIRNFAAQPSPTITRPTTSITPTALITRTPSPTPALTQVTRISTPTTECSSLYQPVCGTNNITYASLCEAQQAGVEISSSRACPRTTPTPTPTDTLPVGF